MIKKIILLTGLMISTSLLADMDNICKLDLRHESPFYGGVLIEQQAHIKESCERNNIFELRYLNSKSVNFQIALRCRYDRNVHVTKVEGTDFSHLTCVLYDNEPREFIKEPDY